MGRRETMPPQRLGNQMPQMMAAAAEVAEAVEVDTINSTKLRVAKELQTVWQNRHVWIGGYQEPRKAI
jgi:hypothetical protein